MIDAVPHCQPKGKLVIDYRLWTPYLTSGKRQANLRRPLWDRRELCDEVLLSDRHSRTTRGRELMTSSTVIAWADFLQRAADLF